MASKTGSKDSDKSKKKDGPKVVDEEHPPDYKGLVRVEKIQTVLEIMEPRPAGSEEKKPVPSVGSMKPPGPA